MKKILVFIIFVNFLNAQSAINYINSIRLNCKMSSLKFNKKLADAAKKHAIYLAINQQFGHFESSSNSYFYGVNPWDRVSKSGFGAKVVVEDISFYEPSYKASIKKLMGTVYHRLALLDDKIDSIGYARYNGVYVYDMSSIKVANLCNKNFANRGEYVYGVCSNSNNIPRLEFTKALNSNRKKSKSIIVYPYPNAKNVGTSIVVENPKFVSSSRYGLPITVLFNSYYYNHVKLKKFVLKRGKRVIASKIVTFRNDRLKKLPKNSFVLLPLKKLQKKAVYSVILEVVADGKVKKLSWSFST